MEELQSNIEGREVDELMDEWDLSEERDLMTFREWLKENHPEKLDMVERVLGPERPLRDDFKTADGQLIDPFDQAMTLANEYADRNPDRAITFWDWMRKERPEKISLVEHVVGSALPPNTHGFSGFHKP